MAKNLITGIFFRGRHVEWTSIRDKKKGDCEIADHREVMLELEEAQPDYSAPETATAVKKACSHIKGQVCVSVPTEHALLRIVELPSVDDDELAGMVELQVDRFSPFPLEHMAVSYEILEQRESVTRVLIAGVRRDVVEAIGAAFGGAGLLPHWMDIEILGWWRLLQDTGHLQAHGWQVVLLLFEHTVEMIVMRENRPVIFRSLGGVRDLGREEDLEDLSNEILYTLTSLETEWGSAGEARLAIWTDEALSPDILNRLSGGAEVETFALKELPPVSEGLARRCLPTGSQQVNLVPEDWHEKARFRHARRIVVSLTVLFVGLWLSGVIVFMVLLNMQTDELTRTRGRAEQLEASAVRVRQLQGKVKSLEEYADRSRSALECLREVTVRLPDGVDLTSFAYRKGKQVNLRGEASSESPVLQYIEALERSDIFDRATTEGISSARRQGRTVTEFKITAQLPGEGDES
jgi:Tfp pilus assembly protein PilN